MLMKKLIMVLFIILPHEICAGWTEKRNTSQITTNNRQQNKKEGNLVKECEDSLNSFTTLQAKFLQVGPDGHIVSGRFYLKRPDNLRLEYDHSIPLRIVADHRQIAQLDKELDSITYFSTADHPISFFLKKRILFSDLFEVSDVSHENGVIRILLKKKNDSENLFLTLIFRDKPISLQKWEVHDSSNGTTSITLVDMLTDVNLSPALFDLKENDPNLENQKISKAPQSMVLN